MSEPNENSLAEQLEDAMRAITQRPEPPLTSSELRAFRKMKDEYEKAAWLKKQILVYTPHIAAFLAGAWGVWTWLGSYFGTPK